MAKAFGVEQDIDVGQVGIRTGGSSSAQISPSVAGSALTALAGVGPDLVAAFRERSRKDKEKAMAEKVTSANGKLSTITNPVERKKAFMEYKNSFLRDYPEHSAFINTNLTRGNINQSYESGSVVYRDADTGEVLERTGLTTPEQATADLLVEGVGVFNEDTSPALQDVAETTARTLTDAGITPSSSELYETSRKIGTALRSVHDASERYALVRSGPASQELLADAQQDLAGQAISSVVQGYQTFTSPTFIRAAKDLGPASVDSMVRAYTSDVMAAMNESGGMLQEFDSLDKTAVISYIQAQEQMVLEALDAAQAQDTVRLGIIKQGLQLGKDINVLNAYHSAPAHIQGMINKAEALEVSAASINVLSQIAVTAVNTNDPTGAGAQARNLLKFATGASMTGVIINSLNNTEPVDSSSVSSIISDFNALTESAFDDTNTIEKTAELVKSKLNRYGSRGDAEKRIADQAIANINSKVSLMQELIKANAKALGMTTEEFAAKSRTARALVTGDETLDAPAVPEPTQDDTLDLTGITNLFSTGTPPRQRPEQSTTE